MTFWHPLCWVVSKGKGWSSVPDQPLDFYLHFFAIMFFCCKDSKPLKITQSGMQSTPLVRPQIATSARILPFSSRYIETACFDPHLNHLVSQVGLESAWSSGVKELRVWDLGMSAYIRKTLVLQAVDGLWLVLSPGLHCPKFRVDVCKPGAWSELRAMLIKGVRFPISTLTAMKSLLHSKIPRWAYAFWIHNQSSC